MYMGALVGLVAIQIFTPTILKDFGYNALKAVVYTIPPVVAAFVYTVLVAVLADKWQKRSPFLFISGAMTIAGYGMTGGSTNVTCRYAGVFLISMGTILRVHDSSFRNQRPDSIAVNVECE